MTFGEECKEYRSEEGLLIRAEHTLEELQTECFDAILLSGFMNEHPTILNNSVLMEKLQEFDKQKKIIAAISIAPILLMRAGILKGLPFMCAAMKEDLLEEGFTMNDMENMMDWNECCKREYLRFIRQEHIITSVIYGFREWAMEIGKMLDIKTYPKSFGLDK